MFLWKKRLREAGAAKFVEVAVKPALSTWPLPAMRHDFIVPRPNGRTVPRQAATSHSQEENSEWRSEFGMVWQLRDIVLCIPR
jgi:hypothetical protein